MLLPLALRGPKAIEQTVFNFAQHLYLGQNKIDAQEVILINLNFLKIVALIFQNSGCGITLGSVGLNFK